MQQNIKLKRFTDLQTSQSSRNLVTQIYQTVSDFPASELYGLTTQIKQSAISISTNIAEGFRRDVAADKLHFYVLARTSLIQLQNQIILAHDLAFISSDRFKRLLRTSYEIDELLSGLIRVSEACR